MKKLVLIALVSAAMMSAPAMANEGRAEVRAGVGFGNGTAFVGGIAGGYDFDMGSSGFFGPEASFDTDFSGFNFFNIGGRIGAKTSNGRAYVGLAYDVADTRAVNAGIGYQHSLGEKTFGKVELRHYFSSGSDINTLQVGFGIKF